MGMHDAPVLPASLPQVLGEDDPGADPRPQIVASVPKEEDMMNVSDLMEILKKNDFREKVNEVADDLEDYGDGAMVEILRDLVDAIDDVEGAMPDPE